jgi:hypothetical protein
MELRETLDVAVEVADALSEATREGSSIETSSHRT